MAVGRIGNLPSCLLQNNRVTQLPILFGHLAFAIYDILLLLEMLVYCLRFKISDHHMFLLTPVEYSEF